LTIKKVTMKKIFPLLLSLCIVLACSTTKKTTEKSGKYFENDKTTVVADGTSFDKAIIIKEYTESKGINAEYQWLRDNFPGYKLKQQSLSNNNKKYYDVMDIITSEGKEKTIYFDISDFFGKY
jgi:hypothetical protein